MKTIPLTKGKVTIVDDCDFGYLNQFKWHLCQKGTGSDYAVRQMGHEKVSMHRVIMRPLAGFEIDHINHDTLDNQRSNLRICTHQQNIFNSHSHRNSNSIYKGVCFVVSEKLWTARITKKFIGRFDSEIAAALAYDKKACELFGEYAYLNFPDKLSGDEVAKFLKSLPDKIFRILFVKRTDGEFREMLCRKGVKKYINGDGLKFDPITRGLLSVYDIEEKGYRFIPLDAVLAVKALGKSFYIYN